MSDLGPLWGEFLKDIVSLCNGYLDFVGQDRYLIIGYCETERKVYGIPRSSIKVLHDIRDFRKNLLERLERVVSLPPLTFEIDTVEVDDLPLLVIRIPSPKYITELKKELQTKTRTLDAGAVLVRKGQAADSIRFATLHEIAELHGEFETYKKQAAASSHSFTVPRERSISKTVQLYIEKNMSFSVDVGFPIVHRDWTDGIIFELFRISEEFGSSKYFLYIHENAVQSKTFGYIKKNKLLDSQTPLIVLTERPDIKDIEKRKGNIKQIFGTQHVFFIDEFGFNYLYGDCIHDFESYNLPVFVESLTTEHHDGDNSALRILDKWYRSVAEPLMVIKGYGGLGKTTLAKQLLDNIGSEDGKVGLLFIDSNDIIDRLSKTARSGKTINDLYDFYQAQHQNDEQNSKNLSKELLRLSVDNGNLFIVLDGIDEVIAKLGAKFDIASFIRSILDSYSNNLERGKILITCRDNFWADLEGSNYVRDITLTPFNANLAKDFFNQAFGENSPKVDRAMGMADKFALRAGASTDGEQVYIPYVLDMISYLIKHKQEFGNENVRLATPTQMLKPDIIPNDFLIGSVCEREIKKLGNCGIDDQLNFLIDFSASSASGHVSIYDVKRIFENATSLQINDEFVEKLKDHPLLCFSNNTLNFRYDFFNQFFRSLHVSRYMSQSTLEGLNAPLVEIFATYVGFDNDFSRSVCARIAFCDDLLMFAIDTIEHLQKKLKSCSDGERTGLRSAISGVFVLLLSLRREQLGSLDTSAATELMRDVFWRDNTLDGVCLCSVFGSDRAKLLFDLRGVTVKNSYFEQYEFFWDCLMDEDTRFVDSGFVALEPRIAVRPQIFPEMFNSECDVTDILEIINKRKKEVSDVVDELKEKLYQFFKLFYKQGNFYPKKQEDVRARIYTGKLLPILLKNKVVADYHDPKKGALKQYRINDEFRPIIKLFEQGGVSFEFERVVSMFR